MEMSICPKCNAQPGEPCTTGGNLPVGDLPGDVRVEGPHRQRKANEMTPHELLLSAAIAEAADMHFRLRKLRAELFGWFWLPCPRCGRMFGGFETGDDMVYDEGSTTSGRVCCRECGE